MVTAETPDFLRRLRAALAERPPKTIAEEDARRASVAVVVTDDAEPAILFVKRLDRAGDPWSGHAAFPGGFQAGSGETPVRTAQREAEEETGLVLAAEGSHLGNLDDVFPRSVLLPRVVVTPCVFSVPGRLPVSAVGEIAHALWIPVREVFSRSNRHPYQLQLADGLREFDSIHVEGLVIWGLTERILQQVVDRMI